MLVVRGHVDAPQGSAGSFAGHRILLTYRRLVDLSGQRAEPEQPAQPQESELPDAAGAPLAAAGDFSLSLPDLSQMREPVEIAVLAPDGAALERQSLTVKHLESELTLTATPVQPFVVRPSDDPTLGQPKRLTGRVIGRDGKPAPPGRSVVIYGVDGTVGPAGAAPAAGATPAADAAGSARALLSVQTQVGGYFSGPWPADPLVAAYGETGGRRAAISIVDGRLPQRAVLVVDLAPVDDDCGCVPAPPRAPDQQDLVANPEAYSQDLGGGCVNLTMPNRVIEEYSYFTVVRITEPDVRPVNTEPPVRLPADAQRRLASLAADEQLADGPTVGQVTFPVDTRRAKELLADPRTITKADIQTAGVRSEAIHLQRLIDLLGGQPTRTELDGRHPVDWDATPTVYEATTVALGHVLHFRQVWRADGYSLGDLLYSLPLAPGQKRLVSLVDWTRRTTGERTEALESEEEMRALTERDRDISEIVGSHLDERIDGGSTSSSSAGGGGVGGAFSTGAFGVLVGFGGGASGSESSSWQDSSRTLSGNSLQQLRDRTSQRASAVRETRSTVVQTVTQAESVRAETEVVANHNHCHAITVEYFEVLRHFQVSQELAHVSECVFVPLPMQLFDRAKARRWRGILLAWLRRPELGKGFDAIDRIATNWDGWDYPEHRFSEEAPEELDGELRISFVIPRPRDAADGVFQIDQWNWLGPLLPASPFSVFNQMSDHVNNQFRDINRQLTAEFNTQIQRARDEYFAREVAPRVAEQIVHRMRFAYVTRAGVLTSLPMDATLISKYAEGVPLYVSVRASGALPALPREQIHRFRIHLDDGTFGGTVPAETRVLVHSGKTRYRTPHLTHLLFDNPRVNNDLSDHDDVMIATPTSVAERKDPRAEDRRLADRLVKHLNEHLEFYHQAIWSSLDPQRRYLLLDGVIAPNSGGRSVASVVENRLIGIVGNCMVLPVTPGIHLDPTLAPDPETGQRIDLIHAYAAEPPPPHRISVPTRGVYAEAIMGECNACEKKDDTRFWRWEESPLPDEPTPIDPISTDSRQAAEADATPTPLPRPIVNIQSAPALPDPLGLSQAMEILGRSDIFREASGLAGTQRNALAAFQGVMDTAKAFGAMATQLAKQQEMGRTVDRTMAQIKGAAGTGMLTQQQASELAHAALQSLAGDPGEAQQNPVHDPDVSAAIEKATESGSGSVTVTSAGETVHASFDGDDDGEEAGNQGGTAVGATFIPKTDPIDDWLNLPLVIDDQVAGPPPVIKYDRSKKIDKLADLRNAMLEPTGTAARDYWPYFTAEKLFRQHPTVAGDFQVGLRMQVCYPTEPGKPGIAGTHRLPVVVLAHGRHPPWGAVTSKATPSRSVTMATSTGPVTVAVHDAEVADPVRSLIGYTYLQEELARQGIVSVSVDARVPDFLDLLIETRADLIISALDYLAKESARAGSTYFKRLDLDKVGLMGHSRGGDAVVRAAKKIAAMPAPKKYTVKAVCSLAPTDFTGADTPADRAFLDTPDTDFYLIVYGALDGDVSGLDGPGGGGGTGFRHYDRARCPKAMVFLDYCIHNSFNTVWHPHPDLIDSRALDQDPTKPQDNHQKLAVDYIGDLFRWQLKKEPLAGRFNGQIGNSVSTPASLQWMFGTVLKRLDDFERGGTNLVGGATWVKTNAPHIIAVRDENQVTHGGAPGTPLGLHLPHQSHLLQVEWGGPRATGIQAYTTDVPAADQDWSGLDTLLISLTGFYDPTDQASIDKEWLPRVRIILTDTAGGSSVVDFSGYGDKVPRRPIWTKKRGKLSTLMRLETVPVPLSKFSGVDLHTVKQLLLELEPAGIVTAYIDNIHVVKR